MLIKVQKASAWVEFANVIQALLIREIKTRFGKYKLGFLWLLLEPITNVLVLGVIFAPILGRGTGEMPYAFFLLCGFMLLKTFRGPMQMGMNALSANQGLLIFRQVEPIDPFIARFIFEILSTLFSFMVFCLVSAWMGLSVSVEYLFVVLYCFVSTWLAGSGLGIYLGIKVLRFKELEKVIGFMLYPLMFVSCVIFPLNMIPPEHQHILLWNPLVHTIESMRQALFPTTYIVPQVNLVYPTVFAVLSLTLGLVTYRNNYHALKQR